MPIRSSVLNLIFAVFIFLVAFVVSEGNLHSFGVSSDVKGVVNPIVGICTAIVFWVSRNK